MRFGRSRVWLSGVALAAAASGCKNAIEDADLVGVYSIKGVLTENSCGQTALPAPNPLEYRVEIREKDGVGYWVPTKQSQNLGSLSAEGQFRFALTQTQIYGMAAPPIDQPADFFPASNGRNDPDLTQNQTQAQCVLTVRQTVTGSLRRRNAADGGGIVELVSDEDGSDLSADNVIDVMPSSGSNCNDALAAFGGAYLALPCGARYVMHGTLAGTAGDQSGASTPPTTGPSSGASTAGARASGGAGVIGASGSAASSASAGTAATAGAVSGSSGAP